MRKLQIKYGKGEAMKKLTLFLASTLALVAVLPGAAHAVDYPATSGKLDVVSVTATSAKISGCGFAPGAVVNVSVDGRNVLATAATAEGCISETVAVSANSRTITASGLNPANGTLTLTATLVASGGTAVTGANSALLIAVGLMILGVGTLFVIVTRRRGAAV